MPYTIHHILYSHHICIPYFLFLFLRFFCREYPVSHQRAYKREKIRKSVDHCTLYKIAAKKERKKLRFNRWPLVHFIQLALISHCRCSIQTSSLFFFAFLVDILEPWTGPHAFMMCINDETNH